MRVRFPASRFGAKVTAVAAWFRADQARRVVALAGAAPLAPVSLVIGAAALLPGGLAGQRALVDAAIASGLASSLCAVMLARHLMKGTGARKATTPAERLLSTPLGETGEAPRGRAPCPPKIFREAQKDALTGLCNRRGFGVAVPVRGAGAVIYARIDGFPALAETLGQAGADRLLRHTAQVLLRALTPEDTLARTSGATYAAWLPGTGEEDAWKVAARLRAAVDERVLFRGRGVGLSIGLAVSDGIADRDTLMTRAGAALDLAGTSADGIVQAVDGDASFLFERERLSSDIWPVPRA